MTDCELCDGSGILECEISVTSDTWYRGADYCHGCPMGALWREAGLNA